MGSRPTMARKQANMPSVLGPMVCVCLSVGCATLEGPLGPDFAPDLDRTPRLLSSPEQPSADELPAVEPDIPSPGGEWACASDVPGDGQPREAAPNTLRGPTSINASCRSMPPLIVIDGVVLPERCRLSDLGRMDIEDIEILKGASAAALYGARATHGVIDIRTSRGTQPG